MLPLTLAPPGKKGINPKKLFVKIKKKTTSAMDEIRFIEENGGLTDKQGAQYVKLLKSGVSRPTGDDLEKIKRKNQ